MFLILKETNTRAMFRLDATNMCGIENVCSHHKPSL